MSTNQYTLTDAISLAIKSALLSTHTALPGEVQSYDTTKQSANIKISINRDIEGESVEWPILEDIPVCFPRSNGKGLSFPLASGDSVLLIFNESNLDRWRFFGPGQSPIDYRMFDINDAVVIPGFYPASGVMDPPPIDDATELRGEKIFIGDHSQSITPVSTSAGATPGTIIGAAVGTTIPSGKLDLITILETFMTLMSNCAYGLAPTLGGGGIDLVTKIALTNLISDIGKLKAGD